MTDADRLRELVRAAVAALEQSRQRIDDLNVYPVPDGDTGTNLLLTVRAVADALESSTATTRGELAQETSRAALMGARGNSGVILSQIVRGAADVLGAAEHVDAATVAAAVRSASDAAYRAVRRPVEGTMLTLIRELAEAAAEQAPRSTSAAALLVALVEHGEDVVARTPEQLAVLREAGVVDAGAAGLLELVRGLAAAAAGEPIPEAPPAEEVAVEAIHQELSRFRYCTTFVVEGDGLDPERLEADLERLGDSLLVVGDPGALRVHVHTDDPGAALTLGTAAGVIGAVEIANMHRQTEERELRLLEAVPDADLRTDVVAVVIGAGNKRLFESLGASRLVEGGQTMNPSTAEIAAAIEATTAPEAVVLPNNANVVLAAEQAARMAPKPAHVVPTESIQAGLGAMVAYDGARSAQANVAEMRAAAETVATGAVTTASRNVDVNGNPVRAGDYLGLMDDEPVAGGASFDEVAAAVVERLLAEPRDVLTLLTGADEPSLEPLLQGVRERHPGIELDVQAGGQPHYPLLLAAE